MFVNYYAAHLRQLIAASLLKRQEQHLSNSWKLADGNY